MVVAWVLVDSDVIERAGEPLKERFLVGDGAENDLVVDTLDDVLGQIGLDAAQNLRFVLISIHQCNSYSLSLAHSICTRQNHSHALLVELRPSCSPNLSSICFVC